MSEEILLDDIRSRTRRLGPEEVRCLYSRVCARAKQGDRSGCEGVLDVLALEAAVGKEFRSTAEFHSIMASYFSRAAAGLSQRTFSDGARLKKKRTAVGLSQQQLAAVLDVSQVQVVHYEKNKTPLSTKALEWLNDATA